MLHTIWTDITTISPPVLKLIIRPILVYIFVVAILRLAGKRALAQADALDVAVFLILANFLQNAGIGNDTSVPGGWIASATLLLTNYLVVRFLFHRARLRRVLQGTPTGLIQDGQVLEDNLNKELITIDDLTAVVHSQGVPTISQVEQAILQPGGTVAVFEKKPRQLDRIEDEVETGLRRLEEILQRAEAIEQRLGMAGLHG